MLFLYSSIETETLFETVKLFPLKVFINDGSIITPYLCGFLATSITKYKKKSLARSNLLFDTTKKY